MMAEIFGISPESAVDVRAILNFVVILSADAINITLTVDINETNVVTEKNLNGPDRFLLQEVFGNNILQNEDNNPNTMKVRISGTQGRLVYSDATIMTQVRI